MWHGSATDLANHARCEHLTQLARSRELAISEGRAVRPERIEDLAMRKGIEFERATVARLRADVEAAGGRYLDLELVDPAGRRDRLSHAMREGIELIGQAPLRTGTIFGYADLLARVEDADAPNGRLDTHHRYVPIEVKFARSVKPQHLLQAAAYADALAELQGELPRTVDVITGDGVRHEHLPAQYVDYVRLARERFDAALVRDLDAELVAVPEPVEHCASCEFAAHCQARRVDADHLSLVARIREDQRSKLRADGIDSLAALAALPPDARVVGIGPASLQQLRTQARLQLEARTSATPPIEYRSPDEHDLAHRGFALLPIPSEHDVFFDFEGYPFHDSGGLEYLWGWTSHDLHAPGATRFDHIWADTPEQEDAAFEQFITEVEQRRAESAGAMHVFHYAPYEITALQRIARRRIDWMARLDELLKAGTFVDLFAVVRQSMLIGIDSYSIKRLEQLYAGTLRDGADLADGGASIEQYEQYLLTNDEAIRDTIVAYNRDDCDSTLLLRDWLLTRRDEAAALGIDWPDPPGESEDEDSGDGATADPHATEQLRARLEDIAADEARPADVRLAARLLGAMPGWGWRIKREFLGDLYGRRHDRDDDDYIREPAAIGDLKLVDTVEQPGRTKAGTVDRTYSFPDQMTLLHTDDRQPDAYDGDTALKVGTIRSIDLDARTVTIRTSGSQQAYVDQRLVDAGELPGRVPTSIVGYADIPYRYLEAIAVRVAESLVMALDLGHDPFAPGAPHAAALSLLARRAPRVSRGAGPEALGDPPHPDELADLVRRLDDSHVVVQGPPGTGKTWTSARLIAALVGLGLKVGISSNSHEAIVTVLEELDELDAGVSAAYAPKRKLRIGDGWLTQSKDNKGARAAFMSDGLDVLAGTAWTFANEDLQLDVLLVDEAGQVSLLGATAMAACTRRVVLVGDPQQLPQPSSVVHPHGCDASMLEHLFDGQELLEPQLAALLSVTRRMHPAITEFVSDSYYRGSLRAFPDTAKQRVVVPRRPDLPEAGTALLDVAHTGNRASSIEEVAAITRLVEDLLDGSRVVARASEGERDLTPNDIIVVAPYNAQRRLLQEALGSDIRVGTVDKFQGKEAAIAIVSMTASSRDELPRGLEFLLDPHRLNVAISRARVLSIVACSPTLAATAAASLEEMRLLNDLARFARLSTNLS
jgi:uncharacterized protein